MLVILLFTLWGVNSPSAVLPKQEGTQQKARLAYRFEEKVGRHRQDESLVSLADSIKERGHRFALRICSKEPLPEALATAALSPPSVVNFLVKTEGYDSERILLLRSEDCLSSNAATAATELWVLPPAPPLPSVETFRACQVTLKPIPTRGRGKNARSYRDALRRLVVALRERPKALGVVTGFHYTGRRRPLAAVRQRLDEARKVLKQSGVADDRYLVRLEPWNDEWSPHAPEPSYPVVYTIEVSKTCDLK